MLGAIIGAAVGLVAAPLVSLLTSRPPLREGAERLTIAFRCDACRASVAPLDAVPLVSFARLHGRCRACAAPISRWDLAAEVPIGKNFSLLAGLNNVFDKRYFSLVNSSGIIPAYGRNFYVGGSFKF